MYMVSKQILLSNNRAHLHFKKFTWFFSFKSAMYRTTNCCQLHCKHVIIFIRWQRWWKAMENLWQAYRRSIGLGAGMQGVELYYPGRQSKPTKQKSVCCHVIYLMHFVQQILLAVPTTLCLFLEFESVLEMLHCGKCDCLLRIFWQCDLTILIFKSDDWNQMHFCRHILLAIPTTSCLFLEFECVVESLHPIECDFILRIWWQRVLAISISSLMTGTRCIFADTFCWPPWQYHVHSWNLKVSWKVCIQANATVSSEFGGNVFSRFWSQVEWLEPDAFLPTVFVGHLDNLMSVLGIWKCLGRLAFRLMRRFLQNLVATCSHNFDFMLDADWSQMHFCWHILLAILTLSCPFLEFETVLEGQHSGKCDCLLRIWWQCVLAISIWNWMTRTRCVSANIL
jgi:hypothetical protein